MNDTDQLQGTPFDEVSGRKRLPGSLNTLTILTFIGSGIGILGTIYQQATGKATIEKLEKLQASDDYEKLPDFAKKINSPEALELMKTAYENRVPLLIITLVGIALCIYGAIEMRKLKKQGYYLYVIGELLPIIGTVIFIGTRGFGGFAILGVIIPVIFIILYATQLKHLR